MTHDMNSTGACADEAPVPCGVDRDTLKRTLSFSRFAALSGYAPHRSQRAIHESGARFRLSVCGRRFGKSMLAAYEAAYHALMPDARVWIVAPYRELATRVFNRTRDVLLYRLRLTPDTDRAFEMTLRFPWGAEVSGRTAENPESLLGEGLDFAVLDEAPRIRDGVFARFILPSLADRRGRALIIGSPSGRGWVYRLASEAAGDSDWSVFSFASGANPHLPAGELAMHRRLLSDADYRREYLAEWVGDTALVYPMFDPARHVRAAAYNPLLPLFAGVDFGFTNPSCALLAQMTPGENLNVLAEVYARGLTANELANEVLARARELACGASDPAAAQARAGILRSHPYVFRERSDAVPVHAIACRAERYTAFSDGLPQVTAFCDPAGAGERAVLERYGIATLAPRAGVGDGIARIRALLAPGDGNIATRISVDPSCRNLIREFGSYAYDERHAGASAYSHGSQPLLAGGDEGGCTGDPKVVKRDDHALDALRYLVTGLGV